MNSTTTLSFDSSFEGYLSAVYTAFSEKLDVTDLRAVRDKTSLFFNEVRYVPPDRRKARRVWEAISQKGSADLRRVYFAFLSENEDLLFPIYEFICLQFRPESHESNNRLRVLRSKLDSWVLRVEAEKRKMEAILRSDSSYGEVGYFRLSPLYDVLPLLTRYCRQHFGSAPWMLVDTKRKYGLCKRASDIERFPLSVGASGNTEDFLKEYDRERNAGMFSQGVQTLQTAV